MEATGDQQVHFQGLWEVDPQSGTWHSVLSDVATAMAIDSMKHGKRRFLCFLKGKEQTGPEKLHSHNLLAISAVDAWDWDGGEYILL